ncbi:hypothetical protein DFH06DRAFT_530226 [Mycena polygramma]|nr:hypothetical protein DFH06DRAFT_530226 [Mycena polygramma]
MAPAMSPPPSWSAIIEPDPSSDEDLVLNDPAAYSTQRKRKKPSKPTTQQSKRHRANENSTVSSNRTFNAVAGPSRRSPSPPLRSATAGSNGKTTAPRTSSGSKVKTSRHSQPTAKKVEPPSTARTRPIKRTQEEKRRQRSSLSSDDLPAAILPPPKIAPRIDFASASAPPARNGAFQRDKVRDRFQSGNSSREAKSAPVRPKGKVRADTEVIEILSSDEDDKHKSEIIDISDSDSERELEKKKKRELVKKMSAERKDRKRRGIKDPPPAGPPPDVFEILDSDEEPSRPVAKRDVNEKREDIGIDLKAPPPNGVSALPPRPDPIENEMDFGDDERMDFDVEDLCPPPDELPGHGLVLPEIPVTSLPLPDVDPSSAQTDGSSESRPEDNARDLRSKAPEQIAETVSTALSPVPSHIPDPSADNSSPPVPPVILEEGVTEKQVIRDNAIAENDAVSLPVAMEDLDLNVPDSAEQDGLSPNDRPPVSPPRSTSSDEKARSLQPSQSSSASIFRPNGLLGLSANNSPDASHNHATLPGRADETPTAAPPPPPPKSVPSKPQSQRMRGPPLPRRSPPREVNPSAAASSQSSQPPSPYKSIRDRALGTSTAALQQHLGLPGRGKPPSLPNGKPPSFPKLDLRTLPVPALAKKRLPSRTTPSSSSSSSADADPTRAEQAETSQGSPIPQSPVPLRPQVKKTQSTPRWDQKRLVDAIITGQHSAPSTAASSPSSLPLRAALPLTNPSPSQAPVKLEEAPSGPDTSLLGVTIDLTNSDDEADASQAGAQSLQGSEQSTMNMANPETQRAEDDAPRTPLQGSLQTKTTLANSLPGEHQPSVEPDASQAQGAQGSGKTTTKLVAPLSASPQPNVVEAIQLKNAKMMTNILKRRKSRSSKAAVVPSNSHTLEASTAPAAERSRSGMDAASSAGDGVPFLNGIDRAAATHEQHTPVLASTHDVPVDMEVDNAGEMPLPLEQHSVPKLLDPPPTVVESVSTGSPERSAPEDPMDVDYERRSYDDTEVYHLEYIGPPTTFGPTVSDPDEDAVEDLVTATPSTSDDHSVRGDLEDDISEVNTE